MFTSRKRQLEDPSTDFFRNHEHHESSPKSDFFIHHDQFDIEMTSYSSRAISPSCSLDQQNYESYSEQQLDYISPIHHDYKRQKKWDIKSNQDVFSSDEAIHSTVSNRVSECPFFLKTAQESRPLIIDPTKVFPSSAYSTVSSPDSDTLIYYFPPHSEPGLFHKIPISKIYQNNLHQFNRHQSLSFNSKQPLVLVFWGIDDDYISTLR